MNVLPPSFPGWAFDPASLHRVGDDARGDASLLDRHVPAADGQPLHASTATAARPIDEVERDFVAALVEAGPQRERPCG